MGPRTILVALLLAFSVVACERPAPLPERPNVVWIVLDALRADHLGQTIDGVPASPFLDGLRGDAISFDAAISQESYTMASVPSYFTSTYPTEHDVLYDQPRIDVLAEEFVTIAEVLQKAGYTTAAFVFNPHLRKKYGFGQGFDVYDDNPQGWPKRKPMHERMETAAKMHAKLQEHFKNYGNRPAFLYLHYRDIHGPYAPPPPHNESFLPEEYPPTVDILYEERGKYTLKRNTDLYLSQYLGEIQYLDQQLARTWELLEREGFRRDNTIFIITADHGEEFRDEHPRDPGGGSHGRTLYAEQIHVPLILSVPDGPRGKSVESWVELIDIAPTILDAAAIDDQPGQFRGQSLLGALRDEGPPPRKAVFAGGNHGRSAVIADGWKYYRYDPDLKSSRVKQLSRETKSQATAEELYRVDTDPFERRNLAKKKPKVLRRMRALADEYDERRSSDADRETAPVDAETHDRLKALGYFSEEE